MVIVYNVVSSLSLCDLLLICPSLLNGPSTSTIFLAVLFKFRPLSQSIVILLTMLRQLSFVKSILLQLSAKYNLIINCYWQNSLSWHSFSVATL